MDGHQPGSLNQISARGTSSSRIGGRRNPKSSGRKLETTEPSLVRSAYPNRGPCRKPVYRRGLQVASTPPSFELLLEHIEPTDDVNPCCGGAFSGANCQLADAANSLHVVTIEPRCTRRNGAVVAGGPFDSFSLSTGFS